MKMKTKILQIIMAVTLLLSTINCANGQSSTTTYKAVLSGSYNSHENNNYTYFEQRAPTDWLTFVAGQSGNGTFEYEYGLNWNSEYGVDFLEDAVNNGFDLVYMYDDGTDDPDFVDYAAQHGCAVITKYGGVNMVQFLDYRGPGSTIHGIGPTPAMTVSCGDQNTASPINQYGPQLEFIDNDFSDAQSYVFSETAARYATIKSAHPTWNVFDVRQALRQTCTGYAAGWNENVGYGFPQVITRNNLDGNLNQPTLPTSANDLDAGPPIQPCAQLTSNGAQVNFTWYNFLQTAFASTVIQANGTTIYDGNGTSFVWTPNISGNIIIQFYTKLLDGRLSRSEIYTIIPISAAAVPDQATTYRNTPIDINVLANDSSGGLSAPLQIVSVSYLPSNVGTISINSDQTIHFIPTEAFLGTASFSYVMSVGGYPIGTTVTVNVLPTPGNQPPTISTLQDQQIVEGSTVEIPFTVTDLFTSPEKLVESLTWQIPDLFCQIVGTGSSRTLKITGIMPLNGAVVTLKYTDLDAASSSTSIHVTVLPNPNSPIVLSAAAYSSSVSANAFSFNASGLANAVWQVYSSTDLKSWTPVGSVTLNASGAGSFTDSGINGLDYRFYKLSDGTYTSHAIGFERKPVAGGNSATANWAGITPIANQLDAPQNTLDGLFNIGANHAMPDGTPLPSGTQISKGNVTYTWNGTSWLTANGQPAGSTTLTPGEEATIYNPSSGSLMVTFVGLVPEGQLTIPVQPGQNFVSAAVAQGGTFSQLFSYNPTEMDTIGQWTGMGFIATAQYYNASPGYPAGWYSEASGLNDLIDPMIQVGEAFIIINTGTGTKYLVQNFSACH